MTSFLNPSDSQAVFLGTFGMYWEEGRSWNFVGEEDWAASPEANRRATARRASIAPILGNP